MTIYLTLLLRFLVVGALEMNLESMPQPVRMSEKCSLDQLPNFQKAGGSDVKMVSLFEQKRLKGFWPVYDEVGGVRQLTVTIAYLMLTFSI